MNASPACLFPSGLFANDPQIIAESLSSRQGSASKGPADGLRLLAFYLAHAGQRLSVSRRRTLEKAKLLLSAQLEQAIKQKQHRA